MKDIADFNPFDAVIIVSYSDRTFYMESANTKAMLLFDAKLDVQSPATLFTGEENWRKLEQCIAMEQRKEYSLQLHNQTEVLVHINHYKQNDKMYYVLVMREKNQIAAHNAEHIETVKHLYFVEQYVDPVISLDLEGTIVYINVAAMNHVVKYEELIGKSIFSFIDSSSIDKVKTLLDTTYEGHTAGGLKVNIKHKIFNEEVVSISSFPTYWDGQIIGTHLIIKNIESLFDGSSALFPAYEDELTGLMNRRVLNDRWVHYATNTPQLNIALMFVDIDRFKRFNESLGKQKADLLLFQISERLKQLRHEHCEVFRYNGDEFVCLIKYKLREEVDVVANKILHILKDSLVIDEQEYFVSASIGISTSLVGEKAMLDTLLHQADQALFHVKANGRAHYRYYRKEMSLTVPNEALMEAHLKRAIEFNELEVHFQPQINLETNTVDSFEALMRWTNRKFGQVPPSQFIPLAESSGLIIQIGNWIIERVFQYQKEWKLQGYKPVRVAVNISPKQLKNNGFIEHVEYLLKKYQVNPRYIEFEITEGSMMDVKETAPILQRLKKLGIYVSVDDFGTGYSSLSYLTTYPIDIIKIDQSFIAAMQKGEKNEALVKAIINLSQNLGLDVIAEGVENETQQQFLIENNCKKVQGYLYDRPMKAEKLVAEYFMQN